MKEKITLDILELVQYNGKIYHFPEEEKNVGVRRPIIDKPEILKRRIEISSELGAKFLNSKGDYNCEGCIHKFENVSHRKWGVCKYDTDNPQIFRTFADYKYWISPKEFEIERKSMFRINPCVADTGSVIALSEFGILDIYQIDIGNADLNMFPCLRDIEGCYSDGQPLMELIDLQIKIKSKALYELYFESKENPINKYLN